MLTLDMSKTPKNTLDFRGLIDHCCSCYDWTYIQIPAVITPILHDFNEPIQESESVHEFSTIRVMYGRLQ